MVLETPGKLNNMDVTILIDLGATESFISPNALVKCKMVVVYKNDFDQVEMASGHSQKSRILSTQVPFIFWSLSHTCEPLCHISWKL
jgi:hypothetical protein